MTLTRMIWAMLCLLWAFAEIRLAHKSSPDKSTLAYYEHKSQKRIWLSVLTSLVLSLWFKHLAWLPIPIAYLPRQWLALLMFTAGIGVRYLAIQQLGLFFTTHVTIRRKHCLITEGLYRRIRHPAYSGLLLGLTAAGIAMGDFLALFAITVPSFWAVKSRIEIEEQMLEQAFSDIYLEYCTRTWKLLPWLY